MERVQQLLCAFFLVQAAGLFRPSRAFQPRHCPCRRKTFLQARKHILYTQQHAYRKISNGTSTLLGNERQHSCNDEDESSLKLRFHEHIMSMLNVETHHKVLMAYNDLMGMSKMYKNSKRQPPIGRNRKTERIIKLRDMFEIDKETSSDVGINKLRWKGTLLQPSLDCYEEVANALVSPVVFRKIGGWEVCRLLEQLLAQVDQQSRDGDDDDVQAAKECINANLIESLSKVGDGPSARQILHREKIARVQKQKEAEKRIIERETLWPRRRSRKNGAVDFIGDDSTPANANRDTKEEVDDSQLLEEENDSDIKEIALSSEEEQGRELQNSANTGATEDQVGNKVDEDRKEVVPVTRASNALTYAKKIHNCYSDSQHDKQAAPRSLQLLNQMVKSLDERPHQLEPDMWIFNTVLLIWARSGRADSGRVAEEILELMREFGRNRSAAEFPYPNDQSYTFVIDAYANSGQKNSGQKALEMLHQLQESGWQPNARCISTTIEAIFKAGDSIPLYLLKRMIHLNQAGDDSSIINSRTFTKAIVSGNAENALQVLDLLDDVGDDRIGPNVVHYNAAIFCVAKSDSTNRTATADKLLSAMEEKGIKGNVVTYTAMLTVQETYDEAERWLWRMEDEYDITPTTRTYNSCLRVILNDDTENATDRALALLSRMESRFQGNNDAKPDLVTYTSIANIFRKHGSKDVAKSGKQADWLQSRVRQMGCQSDDIFESALNHLRLGK